jgi:hypothetical protein
MGFCCDERGLRAYVLNSEKARLRGLFRYSARFRKSR